ncbi:MAG: hypothetical protein SFX18_01420 [Pirellulales bacterium]|nr:hypothetical protein [Pirellulales bacterium]
MHTRTQFESLEHRLPLAGNITASFDNGVLTLAGDDLANAVEVGLAAPGQVFVQGVGDLQQNQPTAINGVANGTQVFTGVDKLYVYLRGGDDELRVNNIALSVLHVEGGTGSDNVRIGAPQAAFLGALGNINDGSVGVSQTLRVDLGTGGDELVRLQRVFGGAAWDLDATSALARVQVFDASSGAVDVRTGGGNDLLLIYNHTAHGVVNINTDGGNDQLQLVNSSLRKDAFLIGGDGDDLFGLDVNNYGGLVQADTGAGNDFLLFSRSVAAKEVRLFTGGGFDTLLVGRYYTSPNTLANGGSTAKKITIDTGAQTDTAHVAANAVDDFYAAYGAGDDNVTFDYNLIRHRGTADGGGGSNPLTQLGGNNLKFLNFT